MRDDFAVFILSNRRPDRVLTVRALQRSGYTGAWYIIVDDQDPTLPQYQSRYGSRVIVFDKTLVAESFDDGDNFHDHRSPIYARNATFQIAENLGVKYFIQLDDDYSGFGHRYGPGQEYLKAEPRIRQLDLVFDALIEFMESVPAMKTVTIAQGGDFIGGEPDGIRFKRKAMNSFLCTTDRPFTFTGKLNDDVNTYVQAGLRGGLMGTVMAVSLGQAKTQSRKGGLSEIYLDAGTYVKSFYTVLYAPSCVRVTMMGDPVAKRNYRYHHRVDWDSCAVKILREDVKKCLQ